MPMWGEEETDDRASESVSRREGYGGASATGWGPCPEQLCAGQARFLFGSGTQGFALGW